MSDETNDNELPAEPAAPPADDRQIKLVPGALLGDTYEIEELLAAGGMAEVFRARNIHTGEPVAVKAILAAFARDTTMLAMFKKEATVLSRLQHDAIVRYYHFTIDRQNGVPYLVMEFVDGTQLNARLARAPFDQATARRFILRVASGLGAAHKAGVVHRDLSPDNIILPDDDVDRAKIIDFGIAKAGTIGGATVVGESWAGKYNYMSPEQLGLFGSEVTERSDIYSLGLIAAAALLGKPLDMAGTLTEIIEKRRTVPDLSAVDEQLRPVIARMLEPKPEDRPANIGAVIAMLSAPDPQASGERTVMARATPPKQPTAAADPWSTTIPPDAPPSNATVVTPRSAPAPADDSPFGPPVAAPKPAFQPEELPPSGRTVYTPPPRERRGNGAMIGLLVVAGLIVVGGGFGYQMGLLDPILGRTPPVVIEPPITEPPVVEPGGAKTPDEPVIPGGAGSSTTAPPIDQPGTPDPATPPEPDIPIKPNTPSVGEPEKPDQPTVPPIEDPVVIADPAPPSPPAEDPITEAAKSVDWLKSYPLQACQFASVVSVADNAMTISALSQDVGPVETLMADFQAARDYEPDISLGLIAAPQCAAVDFLRTAEPIGANGPALTLSRYNIPSGAPFQGFIEGAEGWQLQLLVVDADGMVNAIPLVLSTSGNAASFDLTLTSDTGEAAPMLFVLLASKAGIPSAKLPSPTLAALLFPKLLAEVEAASDPVAVASTFFKLDGTTQ